MDQVKAFQKTSYDLHASHYEAYSPGGEQEAVARTWFRTDTVDAWRHLRKYMALNPILTAEPGAEWLTIGDGRYGKDARYILDNGGKSLATDISDILLKEAKKNGFIPDYRTENAESLSFEDLQFDYVLCKESYHHFPRPMLALYEMLRVCKKGVLLIEPNDMYIPDSILSSVFVPVVRAVKRIIGRNPDKFKYEEVGNYIYSLSRREIEKVAVGINFNAVAFKGINDFHFKGVENEALSEHGPLQRKLKWLLKVENALCHLGLIDYSEMIVILFRQSPSELLAKNLCETGFEIVYLPDNPYMTK